MIFRKTGTRLPDHALDPPLSPLSNRELLADRQAADALSGCGKDRVVHTLDAELAFAANRDLDDGGNVTDKAPMGRDAKPVSLGHRTAPTAFLSDQLDHASQPAGVDRVAVERLAVVPEILHGIVE